jgi:Thioredoxin-like
MYPHERSLVEKMKDKPFTIIGVNSDRDKDKLKKRMEEEKITWRSFWNGPKGTGGPISSTWNVRGWPTLYVIDHKGVIRHKWLGSPGDKVLDDAIEELLKEAEKGQGGGERE